MSAVMDQETAEHFYAWLEKEWREDEQRGVEQKVHAALREYPTLVSEGKTWWDILRYGETL